MAGSVGKKGFGGDGEVKEGDRGGEEFLCCCWKSLWCYSIVDDDDIIAFYLFDFFNFFYLIVYLICF
jgi:hypothetical protein